MMLIDPLAMSPNDGILPADLVSGNFELLGGVDVEIGSDDDGSVVGSVDSS